MIKKSNHFRFVLIVFLTLMIGGFAWHAWQLRFLYFDPYTRDRIAEAMEELAEKEGWLLSDLSLLEANCNYQIKLLHRSHHRGEDQQECFYLNLNNSDRVSCDAYL